MKHLKYFENNSEIDDISIICKKHYINNYHINEDGTVDVNGSVSLSYSGLTELPLKFRYVSGYFSCRGNKLTTLENAPIKVGDWFDCSKNKLTSLEGGPSKVGGDFKCSHNKIVSLIGSPESVDGWFDCSKNKLTSLLGAPEELSGDFHCYDNNLTLPKEIKNNMDHIDKIVKYQSDYNIWRRDGTLDKYRFSDMMKEITGEDN